MENTKMSFKKYLTSLNAIFALEVLILVLASCAIIPREAVLFLTGLIIFYMLFSPLKDSVCLLIMSIPLFVALPISDNFDSMANWRILIAVLFLVWLVKFLKSYRFSGRSLRSFVQKAKKRFFSNYLYIFISAFLLICVFSIFAADYKITAVKKLLFLANAFLLFAVVKNLAKDKEKILKILKAAAAAGGVVLAGGLIQFLAVLFVPLYDFWQFWAGKVIYVFYGQNLAHLLSYANTWFAYYSVNPPTLRLFSVFPDSHSFAMFLILIIPVFLALALFFAQEKRKKIFWWVMTALALGGIILSGSRGAWLSIVPVAGIALLIHRKKWEKYLTKKAIWAFVMFAVLFVFSLGYAPLFYKFQSWQSGQNASTTFSFFERAKSLSDLEEISNKGRLEIWRTSLKSLVKYPVLGVGLGNYVKVLDEDISAAKKGASAHNLYLDFANEIGILGALILIAIFLEILRTAWLVFRRAKEPHFKIFGLLFGLYFLWVMAYSLFDVVLLNDKVLLTFMVGVGALYGIRSLIEKENKAFL